MARGVRKSPIEKIQSKLQEVRESIQQYENCLATLRENEADLLKKLELEEFKEITAMLEEQGMNLNDLKEMLQLNITEEKQSA